MGDLTIRILEARNLIPADRNGKSDPYTTVEILEDPMQKKHKTSVQHKTLNPIWQQSFNFRAPTLNSTILFKVWDRDLFKRNDPLGNVSLSVSRLTPGAPNNMWLDLQGVPTGQLHVDIIFVPFVQAGAPQRSAPYNAQQTNRGPQPPAQYNQPPYPNTYGVPNPTQTYPQQPPRNNAGPYPPGAYSASALNYPGNPAYPQPTSSYAAPPNPTASYNPPPPPTSSYTPGQSTPADDDDVGVDYNKLANDFSMLKVQPQQQPPYASQPPPQSGYSQPPQPPYSSMPAQQPPYASQPLPQQPPYASQPLPQQPPYASQPPPQSGYSQPPPQPGYSQPPYQSYPQGGYPQNNYPPQTGYPTQNGYPPQQRGAPLQTNAQGLITGPNLTKFFVHIKKRLNRDYIVIMDMSGSMTGRKWEQAKDATMKIAPFACQADPDGITLYLFNGRYTRFEHLTQAAQVQSIFSREKPSGTTDLAGVLSAAFAEHFAGTKQTTILVITDGEPDSQAATVREIVRAANRITSQEDLSVSFIQIGDDKSATKFLQFLDDNLQPQGAKFDIVDTVSADNLGAMSFEQLIEKSIYD